MKTLSFRTARRFSVPGALLGLGCLLLTAPAFAQNTVIKSGEKLAFLGDSITQQGARDALGYVNLVVKGLAANGIKVDAVPAGISGHKSNDMLARLDRDVLSKKPQWMTLSCGVNDVWHGARGVKLDDYKTNITAIVDQATAANVKVVILTSTLIYENPSHTLNEQAIPYNDFLRTLAKEKNLPLVDLNADFRAAVGKLTPEEAKKNNFTGDGVHMNTQGNIMMAAGVLRGLGLSEAEQAKARESWQDMPGAFNLPLSLRQMESLKAQADKEKRSVADIVNDALARYTGTAAR